MFFSNSKVSKVGVTVTVDNRMEVIVVDTELRKVTHYEQVEMEYSFQSKELADYMQFASSLKGILDEMKLNPKNIDLTISIPSIHFSTAQVQSNFDDATIKSVLATYAQESYLFKRHEPVIAYHLYPNNASDTMPVVYSAIQESVVDQIKDALFQHGIDKFSINNPYGSVLNGLIYLGKLDKQINSGEIWNFVQITNNGFTLISMIGQNIREINDMPLPLKTFSAEEIYESMALSLQNNLSIYPASSLFVISRTDLLSAQQLLQRMELRGSVDYMENNTYMTEQFIEVGDLVDRDFAKLISVESVGTAITTDDSPLNLCYATTKDHEDESLGELNIFGRTITVNDTTFNILFLIVVIIIIAIGGSILFGVNYTNDKLKAEIDELQQEKSRLQKEITKAKGENEGNVDTVIVSISDNNKNNVAYFNSISREIPSNTWLSYYYADVNGSVVIKGDTASVESLYGFFNGVKGSTKNSSLSLSKLEYNDIDAILSNDGGNKTIKFEITSNTPIKEETADEENSEEAAGDKTKNNGEKGNKKSGNNGKADAPKPDTKTDSGSDDEGLPEPPAFEPPAD